MLFFFNAQKLGANFFCILCRGSLENKVALQNGINSYFKNQTNLKIKNKDLGSKGRILTIDNNDPDLGKSGS